MEDISASCKKAIESGSLTQFGMIGFTLISPSTKVGDPNKIEIIITSIDEMLTLA